MTNRSQPAYDLRDLKVPTRRDLQFDLPADRLADWHGSGGPIFSAFLNTFSIVLPVGERFFIDSVRAVRDVVTDPVLKEAVVGFIGQEAMHGREHEAYNQLMLKRVPKIIEYEQAAYRRMSWISRNLPKSFALSATVAMEHLTALFADSVLISPELLADVEPHFKALWLWHALEETEHKSVAFDVWRAYMGSTLRAYGLRILGCTLATAIFWGMTIPAFLRVVRAERQLTNLPAWFKFFRYTIGDVGMLRRQLGNFFDYYRPGFHPWNHDNRAAYREHLSELKLYFGM